MRNLTTAVIAVVALATAFVGTASAATYPSDVPHVNNPALQDQLERDASKRATERAPLGVEVYGGHQAQSNSAAQANAQQDGAQGPQG